MDLSLRNLWEWTKVFVRDPRLAVSLVKAAKLPLEVSFMMILLAGVIWAVLSGVFLISMGVGEFIFPISETEGMVVQPTGPITQGLFAVLCGTGLGFSIYQVGRMSGGQGSLADIMSVTAILELIVAVLIVAQFVFGLVLPFIGLMLFLGAIFIFVRGLGHVVNEGHAFEDMGKSIMVIVGSFVMLGVIIAVVFTFLALIGVTPDSEIVPLPEELLL